MSRPSRKRTFARHVAVRRQGEVTSGGSALRGGRFSREGRAPVTPAREERTRRSRSATYLLAAAFVAFAIWELIQHVFLMDLPMAAYHLFSLTIEFGLVFVIALVAMRLVARGADTEARQHALHHTVVASLAQDVRPPLVSLLAELRLLERAP